MDRSYYLQLAAGGVRFPIGADLVLREKPDHEAILLDGRRLGQVVEQAARRYRTPLAVPLMDLVIEKHWMLQRLGIPESQTETYQFPGCPDDGQLEKLRSRGQLTPRLAATVDAIRHIATRTDLFPVGMVIGPFSLTTKLLADPITPVFLAGSGVTAADEPEVAALERVLEMSTRVVIQSIELQAEAGAKAILMAEPAANKVFFSPRQIEAGSDIFDRYAIAADRRAAERMRELGVDLIFHCCGELIDAMVERFSSLRPVILSLGSSRRLWEDANLVDKDIILYGNLPSKRFYSDELISREDVVRMAAELVEKMKQVGHPFILGSECDVLSVAGSENAIRAKVDAFMDCC